MRLLDTGTKYFDINSYNVPKLNNTWGCMVDFLDAALVYGSPSQPILGITVTEDVKEPELYWLFNVQLNSGHGFKANLSVVEILNANIPTFNKVYRVQEITNTSITLAVLKTEYPTKPLDLVYVNGVEIKTKALGYEKVFEGFQKAVYKVTTKDDKYCYLRVDNSCPNGHDPSWSKFSRVSMMSEIDEIDDYRFRLGRQKAPAYVGDYNKTEENIYDVWFNTRYYNDRYLYFQVAPNRPTQRHYHIIGDSETFYLFIDAVRDYSSGREEDTTYIFGKYTKLIYKEDPTPFILKCNRRDSETSAYFVDYNNYGNMTRDRNISKHTFKTDFEDIFTTSTSDSYALWLNDSFHSGVNTRLSFKPYKNELNINLIEMNLRFFRDNNTVLEGRYRGLKAFMCNLQDYPSLTPDYQTTFVQDKTYYLRVSDRDYHEQASYAVQLNDWE